MHYLVGQLFQYGLHDTEVTEILINDNKIKFVFFNGVYYLDRTGREVSLTPKCIFCITVNTLYGSNSIDCVEIQVITSQKLCFLEFDDLTRYLKNDSLIIQNIYYSRFNDSVLIDCSIGRKQIIIRIENCIDFNFTFENSSNC